MNVLGMGPMELMLIAILALIVFGPGKLPEIAGQVGRMVRDFRRSTSEMSSEFNRAFTVDLNDPSGTSSSVPAQLPAVAPASEPTAVSTSESLPAPRAAASRKDDLLPPY